MAKLKKGLRLLSRLIFVRAALQHRVAGAIEHLVPIRQCAAAALIDVGANVGQFSLAFRALRPNARIVAFEPLAEAADRYERLFAGDRAVTLHRVAIGDHDGEADFYITNRRDSSSLLNPAGAQKDAFGVAREAIATVPVRPLDACVDLAGLPRPLLVKIDVQGAELEVLKGCRALEKADFVYVELSFVQLYEGQPLYDEVAAYLAGRGFVLAAIFNQAMTTAFGLTQADFLFKNKHEWEPVGGVR